MMKIAYDNGAAQALERFKLAFNPGFLQKGLIAARGFARGQMGHAGDLMNAGRQALAPTATGRAGAGGAAWGALKGLAPTIGIGAGAALMARGGDQPEQPQQMQHPMYG